MFLFTKRDRDTIAISAKHLNAHDRVLVIDELPRQRPMPQWALIDLIGPAGLSIARLHRNREILPGWRALLES